MPTSFTETAKAAEAVLYEAGGTFSRDTITIASGAGVVKANTVVGLVSVGAATATAGGSNTGNGTMSAVTVAAGAKVGTYTVTFTAATKFDVEDPEGFRIKSGSTGVAYSDDIGFTITAGGTAFVAGDTFTIAVAAGSAKYVPAPATGTDGSQIGKAVTLYEVDATSADVKVAAITRHAEVNGKLLVYASSVDDDAKKAVKAAQLATVDIIVR